MMNGITGSVGSYGALGALVTESTQVRQKLDTLTQQASSGLVATTYAGLGSAAGISLNLAPQIATLQTAQNNIGAVTAQMGVTQSAMTQLQQIAINFADKMPNLNGLNSSEMDSIAADARDALQQVAGILNTKDGSVYVFSGQDTSNPPVPSGNNILTTSFFTQIQNAVQNLSTNGASATAAATLQIASSNAPGTSPFSAYLSQPAGAIAAPTIDVGNGRTETAGMIASANSGVQSQGSSTTGSYVRDLMRALATLGSLSSSQVNDPSFAGLIQDTTNSLNGAVTAMAADAGVMGDRQTALTTLSTNMSTTITALTTQVNSVQNVDMTATLSALTSTQTQLQASYRLITMLNSLSLVNYLPAA